MHQSVLNTLWIYHGCQAPAQKILPHLFYFWWITIESLFRWKPLETILNLLNPQGRKLIFKVSAEVIWQSHTWISSILEFIYWGENDAAAACVCAPQRDNHVRTRKRRLSINQGARPQPWWDFYLRLSAFRTVRINLLLNPSVCGSLLWHPQETHIPPFLSPFKKSLMHP